MELPIVTLPSGVSVSLVHRTTGLTAVVRGTQSTRDIGAAIAQAKRRLIYTPPIRVELELSDGSLRQLEAAASRRAA